MKLSRCSARLCKLCSICFAERAAACRLPAEGPDCQEGLGPLRQGAAPGLPGEAGAGVQGQGRLCAFHKGKER